MKYVFSANAWPSFVDQSFALLVGNHSATYSTAMTNQGLSWEIQVNSHCRLSSSPTFLQRTAAPLDIVKPMHLNPFVPILHAVSRRASFSAKWKHAAFARNGSTSSWQQGESECSESWRYI